MAKLKPPKNGVTVRMYRQGHGDCFLIALPRDGGGDPVYVVIDCGYKPGSQQFIHNKPIGDTVAHLDGATGGHIDLMILTHEHQDHLNGIWKKNDPYFGDFKIDEAWLAWTEDPDDDLANELRKRHKDQLLGLLEARRKLALAIGDDDASVRRRGRAARVRVRRRRGGHGGRPARCRGRPGGVGEQAGNEARQGQGVGETRRLVPETGRRTAHGSGRRRHPRVRARPAS